VYGYVWNQADWKRSVDFISDVQELWLSKPGKSFVTSSNGGGMATVVQNNGVGVIGLERAASYMYCSTLLGIEDVYGNVLSIHNRMSEDYVQHLFAIDVGAPLGNYYARGNIYARDWSNVEVFVNPTTVTQTLNVSGEGLYDEYGNLKSIISMPAISGLVLYKSPLI
jgi:hypothetical protein